MTKTFSTTLCRDGAHLVALLGDGALAGDVQAIAAAADHATATIASAQDQLEGLVDALDRYRHVFVVRGGSWLTSRRWSRPSSSRRSPSSMPRLGRRGR
jgi:hypothetical protein